MHLNLRMLLFSNQLLLTQKFCFFLLKTREKHGKIIYALAFYHFKSKQIFNKYFIQQFDHNPFLIPKKHFKQNLDLYYPTFVSKQAIIILRNIISNEWPSFSKKHITVILSTFMILGFNDKKANPILCEEESPPNKWHF